MRKKYQIITKFDIIKVKKLKLLQLKHQKQTWKQPLSPQVGLKLPSFPRLASPPLYTELEYERLSSAKFTSQYSGSGAVAAAIRIWLHQHEFCRQMILYDGFVFYITYNLYHRPELHTLLN